MMPTMDDFAFYMGMIGQHYFIDRLERLIQRRRG